MVFVAWVVVGFNMNHTGIAQELYTKPMYKCHAEVTCISAGIDTNKAFATAPLSAHKVKFTYNTQMTQIDFTRVLNRLTNTPMIARR